MQRFIVKTLICDLDNTLYDWVSYFVPSFYKMVDVAAEILMCEREQLLDDMKIVHQKHHNTEQPYALLETSTVKQWIKQGHIISEIDRAFLAFNRERKLRLSLFDGILPTLQWLQNNGVRLIAHSDSDYLGVVDRLSRLGLSDYFELIYCGRGSSTHHPSGGPFSPRYKNFPGDRLRLLERDEKKPNPSVLQHIIHENKLDGRNVAYIGDSVAKDVAMAKNAGVFSIWAKYGTQVNPDLYRQLVRISHWTEADVRHEKRLASAASEVEPDFICDESFAQIIECFVGNTSIRTDRVIVT